MKNDCIFQIIGGSAARPCVLPFVSGTNALAAQNDPGHARTNWGELFKFLVFCQTFVFLLPPLPSRHSRLLLLGLHLLPLIPHGLLSAEKIIAPQG